MNQHTPGPWKWHDAFGRKEGQGKAMPKNSLGEGPPIGQCSPFSFAVSDEQGFCVAHCTNALVTMSSERSEANASLVAAAPDLLEALDGLFEHCSMIHKHWGENSNSREADAAIDAARAAISKAKGAKQ